VNVLGLLFSGLLRDKAVTGLGLSGFPVREVRRRMEGSPAEGYEVGDVTLIGGDLLDSVGISNGRNPIQVESLTS
jgi:hypothetical protein